MDLEQPLDRVGVQLKGIAEKRDAGIDDQHIERTACMHPGNHRISVGTVRNDHDARQAACVARRSAEHVIYEYIAARHPADAERLADFVSTITAGLSAKARSGQRVERLLATARLGAAAIAHVLGG